jgi:succinoglycan biosynthesis transport protein ExoP
MNMVTLERLNTRLQLNTDDQLKARDRYERLSGMPAAAEPPDPLQTLKQRLAELQSKFTDKHPDVIQTKAQIAELEHERARAASAAPKQVATTRPNPARSIDAELSGLQREGRTLRSEIAAYQERIQWAPKIEQELEAFERDYRIAKDSNDSLQKRYDEAQLADRLEQSKQAESFRILDSAVIPIRPAAPNRMRLRLMACFFAFAAGVGMILLTEHLDTSFHTVGELRQFTTLSVLASIPYVSTRTTVADVVRTTLSVVAVVIMCGLLAGFAYRTARENTQLVWMLSAPQL